MVLRLAFTRSILVFNASISFFCVAWRVFNVLRTRNLLLPTTQSLQ